MGSLDRNGLGIGSLDRSVFTELKWRNRIVVVPPGDDADAFVVRDKDDTEDRIKLTEYGKVSFPPTDAYIDQHGTAFDFLRIICSKGEQLGTGRISLWASYFEFVHDYTTRPSADNIHSIGSDTYRFKLVRAVTITSGELGFDEKVCARCGKQFKPGDELVLVVRHVTNYTLTFPIHLRCVNKPKRRIKVEVPVLTKKYKLTPEGKVEEILAPKTERRKVKVLSPEITFDENTGKFYDSSGREVEPKWEYVEVEIPVTEVREVEV